MKYFFAIALFLFFSSVADAQDEDYVSLQDRLKSNIFLKVDASNTDCFVGEPIIVTYKLYSALATESSILKNPYFDGFDVKDLKGGSDHIASRETVDGVRFDVHTLLKLQLTPRKAGRLTLGALTVRSRVKLVDSRGNEDPILDGVEEGYTLNNGYFTLPVSSVPITVLVTALPGGAKPATSPSNELVGDFKMDVQLSKKLLTPGEQAQLTIMLTGRGDFSKIEQPEIDWPDAADVLAAKVDEDKAQKEDGSGYKSFVIPFTINAPGKYTIPSIRFSFFDAQGSRYKTITNVPIELNVVSEGGVIDKETNAPGPDRDASFIGFGIAALIIAAVILVFAFRFKKRKRLPPPVSPKPVNKNVGQEVHAATLSINEALSVAGEHIHTEGSTFGSALKQGIRRYVESRWGLAAPSYNTDTLQQIFAMKGIPATFQTDFLELMAAIDMNIYSGGETQTDREYLLNKANSLLQKM